MGPSTSANPIGQPGQARRSERSYHPLHFRRGTVIALPLHDIEVKVRRRRNPTGRFQEEWALQQDAPDRELLADVRDPAVLRDPHLHLIERDGAVHLPEGLPRQRRRQQRRVPEVPSTDDEVVGAVQFEEEEIPRLQRLEELLSPGLPEIHFI